MTAANEPQLSHADRHDLDKLARWKDGLDGAGASDGSSFPACAIFLVTGEDRASHDIFRRYRSTFEQLGGGFHHLVIFGQHGVSSTQRAFIGEVGLDQASVPLLVIASMAEDSNDAYCIELQKGDVDGDLDEGQFWGDALRAVEAAAANGVMISFAGIEGVRRTNFSGQTLSATVGRVLAELDGDV